MESLDFNAFLLGGAGILEAYTEAGISNHQRAPALFGCLVRRNFSKGQQCEGFHQGLLGCIQGFLTMAHLNEAQQPWLGAGGQHGPFGQGPNVLETQRPGIQKGSTNHGTPHVYVAF